MHANLHSAINSLNLDHDTLPPNPPFSPEAFPPRHAHPFSPPRPNHSSTSSFSLQPPWVPHASIGLKWTWIGQDGHFLTTGDLRDTNQDSSETESESLTTTLFYLDSLNESRPEAMQGTRWTHGQIPESPDFVIRSLVQRVNRGQLRFDMGDSSLDPRLFGPHVHSYNTERMQDDLSHLGLDGGLATNSMLDSPNDSLGPHHAFKVEPQN